MSRILPTAVWILLALAAVASFAVDWANVAQGGAIDLRNRITGVRLLEHGINPYHFKWVEGKPPEYCDPMDSPNRPVSRTTATPALLLLHAPFAALPYRSGEYLWLVSQWFLLLGTAALWMVGSPTARTRGLVALVVVGFSFTSAWRLHAERGQCYVLLLFLFAWWLTATLDPRRRNGFLAGCLAGFLVALRPPFLLLVPFLALHRRGQLAGAATGLVLGLALPMLLLSSCWSDYFSSVQTFSYFYRYAIHSPFGSLVLPAEIEGMPLHLISHSLYLPAGIFSVHEYLKRFGLEPFPAWPPLAAVGAGFFVWLWLSRAQAPERLLPGLAAWLFIADLFLPVYRESYDDVLILNVIAAGFAITPQIPWAAWPCLVALPLGTLVYVRNMDHPWVILPSALFTLGAILFLLPLMDDAKRRAHQATG